MMKNKIINLAGLAFLSILLAALLVSCAPSATPAAVSSTPAATDPVVVSATDQPAATDPVVASPDGATLMDERCSVCHSTGRITSAHKTADAWTTTVDRMIGKGAELSADEKRVLLDYLIANYK